MAHIQKRLTKDGKTRYRAQVRLRGHPPQTATFGRRTDAKKWVQQTEAAIREGRYFKTTEARKHTFADLADRYLRDVMPTKPKSEHKQTAQLLWWKEQLGHYTLADITPALIAELRDGLRAEKTRLGRERSGATVNRYLAILSHAFTYAVKEREWVQANPVAKVSRLKEPRGRVRFLEREEVDRLLAACLESSNPHLYPMVVLAVSTGMRRGEISNLKRQDIDFDRERLVLNETKNDERRGVPLGDLALRVLKEHLKVTRIDSDLVFPARDGKQPVDIRAAWLEALAKAEIEDFRFHDLRHTAASHLAMDGASLQEIAHVLGHKTMQMVKRYSHLSDDHTANVVASMNRKLFGGNDAASGLSVP